jgi:hypothetical protein
MVGALVVVVMGFQYVFPSKARTAGDSKAAAAIGEQQPVSA